LFRYEERKVEIRSWVFLVLAPCFRTGIEASLVAASRDANTKSSVFFMLCILKIYALYAGDMSDRKELTAI